MWMAVGAALLAGALTAVPEAGTIRLVEPEVWPPHVRADVDAAVAALPPGFVRELPGGVLELELHAEPSPFAMGDGTDERPVWTGGRSRFHLYACAPVAEHHALLRLERLSDDERCVLWRRRAVVHAIFQRWEDARRWSDRRAWRRINGWLRPFERPTVFTETALSTWPGAYSRLLGMTSAAMDLITFAEEALVPAESIREGAVPPDDRVRCQALSKWRFLEGVLRAEGGVDPADPRWQRGACPAFEAWADVPSLSHVEVLFVAASGRAPESLFGHLLLRLVRRPGDRVQGPGFGTAVQLVALTGSDPPNLRYMWRGLTGGYQMAVLTAPTADLFHQVLEHEQRSIRRFRLDLSAAERERFLERVWELERRGYFEYWFFSDNCATLLAFLVDGALEEGGRRVELPPRLAPVLPSAVLDALARAGVLVPEPGAFESVRDRAQRAEDLRDEVVTHLTTRLPDAHARALERLNRRLRDPRLPVRRIGWARLVEFTGEVAPGASEDVRAALYELWRATVRIERYAVERADAERREILAGALDPSLEPRRSADETVRDRQATFEREDPLRRRLAVLDRIAQGERWLQSAPHRPYSASEQAVIDRASALAEGFRALTDAHAEVVRRHFADVPARAVLAREEAARAEEERAWAGRALQSSGYARLSVGLAVLGDALPGLPLLSLSSAALDERLGDQRVHGFQPSSEIRVLAGTALLRPHWGLPEIVRSEVTLLGYRTLQQELPTFRSDPWDSLGWGARLAWDVDAERRERDRALVQLDTFARLDASPRFHRFAALGVGVAGQLRWDEAGRGGGRVGPAFTWLQRTPLGRDLADALRWEVSYRPAWTLRPGVWTHEVTAATSLEVRTMWGTYRGVVIRPRLSGTWERDVHDERLQVAVELQVEPLR